MVKTRRMIKDSAKPSKPKKIDRITKSKKVSHRNTDISVDDLLKLCKPFTIKLERIVHISNHESK